MANKNRSTAALVGGNFRGHEATFESSVEVQIPLHQLVGEVRIVDFHTKLLENKFSFER